MTFSKAISFATAFLVSLTFLGTSAAAKPPSGAAAQLLEKAARGPRYEQALRLQPEVMECADGRTFAVIWRAVPKPTHWIVSLHGSHGFATEDLTVWAPHLEARPVGILCLQWWMGEGDSTESYLTPQEMYSDLTPLLRELRVTPGTVMLEGFSRGSTNTFALAALDAGQHGQHWFSLCVAQSGGVSPSYPPTRAIDEGVYGLDPLKGTRWITVGGGRDPNPDRDGSSAMRRTASWLKARGAIVLEVIDDPQQGHGAMHRSKANTARVLDLFLLKS